MADGNVLIRPAVRSALASLLTAPRHPSAEARRGEHRSALQTCIDGFVESLASVAERDSSSDVRQASLQVWKSIITNTPKTLVEIMGDLERQV